MPNGGADNCVCCGFNEPNEGEWHHPGDGSNPSQAEGSCLIRDGLPTPDPYWTYCVNFHTRSTDPSGPVYTSGLYETGYSRIPWNGAFEPQTNVPATCVMCGVPVDKGITVALDRRTVVGACSNAHYVEWWRDVHPGEPLEWDASTEAPES